MVQNGASIPVAFEFGVRGVIPGNLQIVCGIGVYSDIFWYMLGNFGIFSRYLMISMAFYGIYWLA